MKNNCDGAMDTVKKAFIYLHTSPSGKSYVGQTYTNPKKRWDCGRGYKGNTPMWKAIKKYGWENFTHEILEEIAFDDIKDINILEEQWMLKLNTLAPNGYNLICRGENHLVSEETQMKMSESAKNRVGGGMTGKHHSEESKKKMGFKPGHQSWNKGKKGLIPWNKGLKGYQIAWNKGKKTGLQYPLQKDKLEEAYKTNPYFTNRPSRPQTEETRRKISENMKKYKQSQREKKAMQMELEHPEMQDIESRKSKKIFEFEE